MNYWAVWEIIVNIAESFLFCYLLLSWLGCENKKQCAFGLALLILFVSILNFTISDSNIVIAAVLVANICFSVCIFDKNLSTRFFVGCLGSVIAIVSNTLAFYLASLFSIHNMEDMLNYSPIRFQMTCIYLILEFIIVTILVHRKQKELHLPILLRLVFFGLLFLGILSSDKLLTVFMDIEEPYSKQALGIAGGLYLCILLALAVIFEYMGVLYRNNMENLLRLQEVEMQKGHFKNIQQTMQAIREWRHDYRSHMQTMHVLLQEGQIEALKKYFSQLDSEMKDLSLSVMTGNTTLDAVVTSKMIIAKSKHIAIEYSIALPKGIYLAQTQLCSMLGNMLDNAIDACVKEGIQTPYIYISIKKHRQMLILRVTNSSNGKYLFEKDKLATTKSGAGHGIGCKRIAQNAESLGGFCRFEPGHNAFTVTVAIPIQMTANTKEIGGEADD